MFFKLKGGVLNKIVEKAFRKAGNIRKLEEEIKIPRSTLSSYHTEKRLINENNLRKLEGFLNVKIKEEDIIEKFSNNWKQVLGGKNCVKIKVKRGLFNKQLKVAQKNGAIKLKEWHKKMKEEHPKEYHIIQYEKFKKIAGYKYITDKGEKVRNNFEKEIANILNRLNIKYQYEPLINIKYKYFFPDFLINKNIIIEATSWKGETKAYKLKNKIKYLKKRYKIYIVIPKNLYRYYKILNNHLILGLDEFVPVAQTFLHDKK